MKTAFEISLLQHEQPGDKAWKRTQRFAADWNKEHIHRFRDIMGFILKADFPDGSHPELVELSKALDALAVKLGTKYQKVSQRVYEPADFEAADFVHLFGVGLDDDRGRLFVVNERQVLEQMDPCPRCGTQTIWDQEQSGPFVVDERLLDGPLPEGTPAPEGGWDLVNAPAGHLIASARLQRVLADSGATGYELEPVFTKVGKKRSKRVAQLLVRRAILTPCSEHTKITDGYFCPVCGATQGDVEGDRFYSDVDLDGDEIFSQHRNRGALLHVSGRLYRLMQSAGLKGIIPNTVARRCRHS